MILSPLYYPILWITLKEEQRKSVEAVYQGNKTHYFKESLSKYVFVSVYKVLDRKILKRGGGFEIKAYLWF